MQYPLTTFSVFFFRHAFFSYFVNLKFPSPQIIKSISLMEKSKNKKVQGTEFSNTIFLSGFLNWLTWQSTPCIEEIRWSQSRNRHNRKVRGTYFLNTVFLRSFLSLLTLRETPYFPSQSMLVRTSSGVSGNKIELFCGKYNSKYGRFSLIKLPVWKIPWCFSHFFKKNICSFTMAFTLDHVKNSMESNSVYEPRNAESVIYDRLTKSFRVTYSNEAVQISHSNKDC